MTRSGVIFGAVMLVLGGVVAFLLPICVPCLALFVGVAAGYLASHWDQPAGNGPALRRGAGAGLLAGAGSWLGHLAGGWAAAALIGPEQATRMSESLLRGLGLRGVVPVPTLAQYYTQTTLLSCCFGMVEIVWLTLLGMLGGLLWWQMTGKSRMPAPPPAPTV